MRKQGSYKIKNGKLQGEITVPSSKSHTLRALLFATLAKGKSIIHNALFSSDTQAMIKACEELGASIKIFKNRIEILGIAGKILHSKDVIHAGNSGIILRFFTALGSLGKHPFVITGDHSIKYQRPIQPLLDALLMLKASVKSMRNDDYAPVIIQGPIQSGKTIVYGQDSQFVSALLIALSFAQGPFEIEVKNPGETPWIDLTLNWLKWLELPYQNNAYTHYHIPGNGQIEGFEYHVPGDLSSAAFPIAAALVTNSELTLRNVDMQDIQGDKELIYIFQKMGAQFEMEEKTLHVKKGASLNGVTVDINPCIDGITLLATVACFAEGETVIYNGAVAKQKECNRIEAIAKELKKMNGLITETEDGLIIKKSSLKGALLHTYNDHRMVMSLAVAALGAQGETIISPVHSVSKTFPTFAKDFQTLGALIQYGK